MAETTTQMLTRMTEVTEERKGDKVNELLGKGWRLLAVDQVEMRDGSDSWIETKYVLGYPNQDPLSAFGD
ncbi:hypothetical protein ACTUVK_000519 [Stenotrophomonas rhizophila]